MFKFIMIVIAVCLAGLITIGAVLFYEFMDEGCYFEGVHYEVCSLELGATE